MKKKKTPRPVILGLVAAAVVLGAGGLWMGRYASNKKQMNQEEYYGLSSPEEVALIVDDQVLEEKGLVVDGSLYIAYQTVWNYMNSGFYWEEDSQQMLLTLPEGTLSWSQGDGTGSLILGEEGDPYLSAACIQENSDIEMKILEDPQRIVARTRWDQVATAQVSQDTSLRYRGGNRSEILTWLEKGEEVIFLEDLEDWCKISTEDGYVGYVKTDTIRRNTQAGLEHETDARFVFDKISLDYKVKLGWHYVDNWESNTYLSQLLADAPGLNIISPTWLSVGDDQGKLISYAEKAYVDQAHAAGVQVWAMLGDVNGGSVDVDQILAHASVRSTLISQLMQVAADCGLDGINVDFERIREDSAPQYLQFLKELCVAAHQQGLVVSVDNFVPLYTKYYKRREQAKTVDYLIIMGYDEHTASSEEIGSVASLPFVEEGITDTLQEVPKGQVINAIPFYTRGWIETFGNAVPESQALGMDGADAFAKQYGIETVWDASVGQKTGSTEDGQARYSIWMEDEESIAEKMKLIVQYDLAGMAAWRLGLERSSAWDVINSYLG